MDYLLYLGLGGIAGLMSGLFGIGGGNIIVPILILSFSAQGISGELSTHLAIATSLACIAVTSVGSIYTHYQKRVLDWHLLKLFVPSVIIGSFMGTFLFVAIEGTLLQLLLGGFLVLSGVQMIKKEITYPADIVVSQRFLTLSGVCIGGVSSMFGVGGGMFTAPLLSNLGVRIHSAIATGAVGGFFVAVSASIVYGSAVVNGSSLPASTVGYIFMPAWIGIIVTSMPFARVGALLAHRIDATWLKKIFGWFLFFVGFRFVWINTIGY